MKNILTLVPLLLIIQLNAQDFLNNSLIAFTIPEKDLLSESISYDPETGDFYVSSTRKGKILKRASDGTTSDFATVDDGLWMTIGHKIDTKRNHMWVCSSGGENLIGYNREGSRPAGIFQFDLKTGDLLWKHTLDNPNETHFFNDLVIASNGDVYATHMFQNPGIFKIDGTTKAVSLFSKADTLRYPNGLSFSDDEKYLFVAHSGGIGRIEIASGEWINLSSDGPIKGNDGLYFYDNSLIGVQQDERAVAQYYLDENMENVTRVEILEKNHPMMIVPTTGVLVEDKFYYIANAQFDSFNEDGSLIPMDQLYELVVLKLNLE